jgi:hypothetical protein
MEKTDLKWAFVGDLQIPYEDQRAVALWFKVMKWWKPDAIDFVGDIDDQLEYSRFSDGTTDEFFTQLKLSEKEHEKAVVAYEKEVAKRAATLGDEDMPENLTPPVRPDLDPLPLIKKNADGAKSFYDKVRKQHKDADMHLSMGNHDIRIFKYIDSKAPDLADKVTPNMLWGVDDLGITYRYYHEKPYLRFANTYVHHGVTTSQTGPTVLKDIQDYGVSLVRGHSHRAMLAYKTYPMTDTVLHGLETGHMCDPQAYGLQYASNPDWDLGFGLAHIHDGNISLQFVRISPDYTCVVDGRLFRG